MEKNLIRITDIYLKAFVEAHGYKIDDAKVELIDGRRTVIFLYEESPALNELIQEFRDSQFMRAFIREYLKAKRDITTLLSVR